MDDKELKPSIANKYLNNKEYSKKVEDIQKHLKKEGFDVEPDGMFGRNTVNALYMYNKKKNANVSFDAVKNIKTLEDDRCAAGMCQLFERSGISADKIGITYNSSYEKTKEAVAIIRDILKKHPSTDNYWVYFKDFSAYS